MSVDTLQLNALATTGKRMTCPTVDDLVSFIGNQMGVPESALASPLAQNEYVLEAYEAARATVSHELARVSPLLYKSAFLNFAGDYLIDWAGDAECSTFFADLRKAWNINGFTSGVVESTTDVSTSVTLKNPDAFANLQIGDLQLTKTPYGRQYLAIAQKIGSIWGAS